MDQYNGLTFTAFDKSDVEILTPIMKRAFDEDSRRHLNEPTGGPDGYDNGDFLRKYALNKKSDAYKVSWNGKPVGAVIVWINKDNINYLGNIFIDPDLQDKGFGKKVWGYIENKYPDTIIWRTETPGFSKRNHHFYVNKCGFKIVRIVNPKDKYEESYQMEKVMK
ncbi:MAG: GNAT family N-acetyltransferase [Thermoclostridium sp.]|nr:GNAT family N-acetyltransferase [Thermoclostridium sp.]